MSNITYRPARLEELSELLEFEQGIISAERPFDPTLKPGHINYYDLKELIQSEAAEVVVAESDGEIVGSGYAQIRKANDFQLHDRYAYLGFMFVKPSHRGKGIVSGIMDDLKAWSAAQGLNEIRLEVYNDNGPAVRAYEKAGFTMHMVEMRIDLNNQ